MSSLSGCNHFKEIKPDCGFEDRHELLPETCWLAELLAKSRTSVWLSANCLQCPCKWRIVSDHDRKRCLCIMEGGWALKKTKILRKTSFRAL